MIKVQWSERATAELEAAFTFIGKESQSGALRIVRAIERATENLAVINSGRYGRSPGHFEKVVPRTPYIIFYEVVGQGRSRAIHILRVVHGAQNWANAPTEDTSED